MDVKTLEEILVQHVPTMAESVVQALAGTLVNLGIEKEEDLGLVEEKDLTPLISVIQARKLVAMWKKKCKYTFCIIYKNKK